MNDERAAWTILPDREIARLAVDELMIEPFIDHKMRHVDGRGIISKGLTSFGYDISIAQEAKVFVPFPGERINPKRFSPRLVVEPDWVTDEDGTWFELPPNSFTLMRTVEFFRIPKDVMAICMGKSTYARCGQILNTTPFEPGWRGYVTLEMSNSTSSPVQIFAGEGIGQVLFFRGPQPDNGYGQGKYQDQRAEITLTKSIGGYHGRKHGRGSRLAHQVARTHQ
jgi:dCTP deaminase